MAREQQQPDGGRPGGDGAAVGQTAIKWSAIVIIVVAILFFLARYVMPLMPGG